MCMVNPVIDKLLLSLKSMFGLCVYAHAEFQGEEVVLCSVSGLEELGRLDRSC